MNILIVGNGFDLSHYLPTKYEHFMSVMKNIEKWQQPTLDMHFDDLFELRNSFFQETKSIYQTDKISIPSSFIKDIKQKLPGNVWYQFFSHHLKEIDTWIDFESEFSNALDLVAVFSEKADETYNIHEKLERLVLCRLPTEGVKKLAFKHRTIKKLSLLGILELTVPVSPRDGAYIKEKYYRNKDSELDLDFDSLIRDLESSLKDFIDLFQWYLKNIVQNLEPENKFQFRKKNFEYDDLLILSFNYTSTFSRFYSQKAKVEYVHGSVNKELVLGIPDLNNEFLKKFKNYSFTKYHQKLLKNTDYLFLNENSEVKSLIKSRKNVASERRVNIYIWGHSLADSDANYVHEIFSMNQNSNLECIVTVYFHQNDAPKLLNNLLDILKKDIVEQWMKKGWLKFEKNPEIDFGIEQQSLEKEAS